MSVRAALANRGRWAALAAGAALPLCFAPFAAYFLAWPLLAILFWLCADVSPREAAWRGFWFGFAGFGAGTYWLYISMHGFAGAPAVVAIVLMLALWWLMAVYLALAAALVAWLDVRSLLIRALLVWPAAWVGVEWARATLFTGFPWLALAYGQIDGPLAGVAPVGGVYGVSLLSAVLSGAALVLIVGAARERVVAGAVAVVVLAGGLGAGGLAFTAPSGAPLTAHLIQGSIPQDRKWRPEQLVPTLQLYERLTFTSGPADVVIWPEAAVPSTEVRVRPFLDRLDQQARARDLQVYLGILTLGRSTARQLPQLADRPRSRSRRSITSVTWFRSASIFPVPGFRARVDAQRGPPEPTTRWPGPRDQPAAARSATHAARAHASASRMHSAPSSSTSSRKRTC